MCGKLKQSKTFILFPLFSSPWLCLWYHLIVCLAFRITVFLFLLLFMRSKSLDFYSIQQKQLEICQSQRCERAISYAFGTVEYMNEINTQMHLASANWVADKKEQKQINCLHEVLDCVQNKCAHCAHRHQLQFYIIKFMMKFESRLRFSSWKTNKIRFEEENIQMRQFHEVKRARFSSLSWVCLIHPKGTWQILAINIAKMTATMPNEWNGTKQNKSRKTEGQRSQQLTKNSIKFHGWIAHMKWEYYDIIILVFWAHGEGDTMWYSRPFKQNTYTILAFMWCGNAKGVFSGEKPKLIEEY